LEVLPLDVRLTGTDDRMLRLLEFLPSTPEVRESVWLTDFGPLWAAWASQGVDRPTDEDGAVGMDEFFDLLARNNRAAALFARPRVAIPRLSGFDAASAMVNTFRYLGFDERHIDAAAVSGRD
jgi:hypothetical protein